MRRCDGTPHSRARSLAVAARAMSSTDLLGDVPTPVKPASVAARGDGGDGARDAPASAGESAAAGARDDGVASSADAREDAAANERSGATTTTSSAASNAEPARVARVVAEACEACWGAVPLLRATSSSSRDALSAVLEQVFRDATNAGGAHATVISLPGSGKVSGPDDAGVDGAAMLREHWAYLRALDAQLSNACASFSDDDDGAFTYDVAYEVVREWNGVVLEAKAVAPTLKSASGLTKEEYKKITGASQWIRGVLEGAVRILLSSIEAMAMPTAWQVSLPTNAKEIVGIRLYNDLSVDYAFDPDALADRECFWGTDIPESEGSMSEIDVWTMLDALEKAEAIWSAKMKEQQTIDAVTSVQLWGYGSRAKALSKRLRNSSAYRRVLYNRYPSVEFTSLQQMKIAKNEDVALAALAAYAGCLIRVASALRERAMDVVEAHHNAVRTPNPFHRRPKSPGLLEMFISGTRRTSEWAYDFSKSIEKSLDDTFSVFSSSSKLRSCCAAAPSVQGVANRSPAPIHFINDSDSDDET